VSVDIYFRSNNCHHLRTNSPLFDGATYNLHHVESYHPHQCRHRRGKHASVKECENPSEQPIRDNLPKGRHAGLGNPLLSLLGLPVVTGAILWSIKVRFLSVPPTYPKWHFLDKGLEEYRTAKKTTLSQESERKWLDVWNSNAGMNPDAKISKIRV